MVDCDIAYYEYYNCEINNVTEFTAASGQTEECAYYYYTPKGVKTDGDTPVIVWVTHGGGVAEDERALALSWAASQDTEAIFVVPHTDVPEAVCASIEDAKAKLKGKGDFSSISGQGTSSGGRAIIRAALKSTDPKENYSFRFENIFAYDPASETGLANITGNRRGLRRLAEQGMKLILQTDDDPLGYWGGSGLHCNEYARVYSELGGIAVLAETGGANHEVRFLLPISHNAMNWAIGRGVMEEYDGFPTRWFFYEKGEKFASTPKEVTELLRTGEYPETREAYGDEAEAPAAEEPAGREKRPVLPEASTEYKGVKINVYYIYAA